MRKMLVLSYRAYKRASGPTLVLMVGLNAREYSTHMENYRLNMKGSLNCFRLIS